MKKRIILLTIFVFSLLLSACSSSEEGVPKQNSDEAVPVSGQNPLKVNIINSEGIKIGHAALSETNKGVKIHVEAENLEPGTKAIHIHETGKCEAPSFKSAGAHFNPKQKEHGFENPKGFHAGDLPNIVISEKGTVNVEIVAPNVTLKVGEPNSLLDEDGSALVIHKDADDYKTDPAGNAGDRIACAVVKSK